MRLTLKIPTIRVALDELMKPVLGGISIKALVDQPSCHHLTPIGELAFLSVLQPFTDHKIERQARDIVS
ncbi:hypothetical protein D4Q52_06675 [Rhodopseudomonas palustris]|uniref:Uncharacterized protein n=1 Tax=Rhodopseudomonas palustris TaxID=1076 RepID=A0A418VJN8_RHOPL|nr:hypothetical protein D4Q52_06675 [Rhodopseudomonas palustris]